VAAILFSDGTTRRASCLLNAGADRPNHHSNIHSNMNHKGMFFYQ
jgi:hypothetical protein